MRLQFKGYEVNNFFLPSASRTSLSFIDSTCPKLGDNLKPTGISNSTPIFLEGRNASKGLPVNVDESCVHGTDPSASLEGKAAVLMNYSHFRKLGLDQHQGEIVLAGLGLLDRVHMQIHGSWLIDPVDALGPER